MQTRQGEVTQYMGPDRITDKELQRLRQACRLALERYVDLASDENGRLVRLRPESISELDRLNIMRLSRKESAAREAYSKAKAALVAYLEDTVVASQAKPD
jgi:hypothetical protein